jgi:uncharacterized membrane protein
MRTNHFKAHFLSGLLLLAPALCTILLIAWLVRFIDRLLLSPLGQLIPFAPQGPYQRAVLHFTVGLAVVVLVALVGMLAEKFILRGMFQRGDALMTNIPVVNRVYLTFKEIARAIWGDKSGLFRRVVFIEYPRKGLYAVAFVTQERQWDLSGRVGRELIGVFLPHPPNPASGYLVFVPKEDIIEVTMSTEEAIRLVVSAGAVVPRPE